MVSKQNERETGEGRVLAGRDLALRLRARVSAEAMRWRQRNITPRLAVVWVEGDLASEQYAQTKLRSAEKLGISVLLDRHPGTVSQEALIASVEQLNRDPTVHGILLELPLPTHCQVDTVTQALDAKKDVDGLSRANHLALITGDVGLYPATPLACLRLLQHYGYDLVGKHVVLVGCGKTVGAPLLHLLLRARATVTVCHADTVDLTPHLKQADIALVAVGHPGLITKAMVHPGLTLIDVGINPVADGKVVGDVDPQVAEYVLALSPTPGGVGAVTTVEIFANLMRAMAWQHQESWPEF
jgi:methylenetetrahydrofolate dehydrogenase (NADP+)/methenyltetrahydrofolate cyclohydrolase